MLVGLKTDLLDESLHACVLRRNILADTRVVGVFDMSEMGELHHYVCDACQKKQNNDRIVDVGCDFSLFHNYKEWVVYLS